MYMYIMYIYICTYILCMYNIHTYVVVCILIFRYTNINPSETTGQLVYI